MFIHALNQDLKPLNLLKHPFYQKWNEGSLTLNELQDYAKEYYHHVKAFPKYIYQIAAYCDDDASRHILLENINEEEQGEHVKLWADFAIGIGVKHKTLTQTKLHSLHPKTQHLVNGYYDLVQTDYATGLGALYAYEHQTPAISDSKIAGLKTNYQITNPKTLKFFELHGSVDLWHTEQLESALKKLNTTAQKKAKSGALKAAELLWGFLDGRSLCRE